MKAMLIKPNPLCIVCVLGSTVIQQHRVSMFDIDKKKREKTGLPGQSSGPGAATGTLGDLNRKHVTMKCYYMPKSCFFRFFSAF